MNLLPSCASRAPASIMISLTVAGLLLAIPVAAQHASDVMFDPSQLRTVKVTMTATDWQELVAKPELNKVYPCTFEWDGKSLTQVGVKAKGQGSRIPGTKPSLRFRFNEYKDQDYLKLKRLDAQAMKGDPSMMRERLIYGAFHRRGIVAPRAMHVLLYVNDAYIGLYTLLDQFDQAEALRMRFGNADGNLYKVDNCCAPGDATFWRGPEVDKYIGPLYSWERQNTPNPNDLLRLIDVVNNISDTELALRLPGLLDVDLLLEYCALNQIVANEDWLFSDVSEWSSPVKRGAAWANNFYFYFDPKSGRASSIVWDVDVSMQDNYTPGTWTKRSVFTGFDHSVLSRRVMSNAAWRQAYVDKVLAIVDGAFDAGTMVDELDRIYAQIKDAAEADSWKPFTNASFHYDVSVLRTEIPVRVGNVRTELGCPASTATSYGAGCAAAPNGPVPVHDMTGIAVPGRSFALRVRRAPAGARVLVLVGVVQTSVELSSIGLPGCTMLVDPSAFLSTLSSTAGVAAIPVSLPPDNGLLGARVYTQFAIDNPGGGSSELSTVASNGLLTEIKACK